MTLGALILRPVAVLLAVFGPTLTGCGGSTPGNADKPPSTGRASAAPTPYRVSPGQAAGAIRRTIAAPRPLSGRPAYCGGHGHGVCTRPHGLVWLRQVNRSGAPIPQGNGFSVNGYLVVGRFGSPRSARRFVANAREQHRQYDGTIHVNLANTGPRTYTPGESGTGVISDAANGPWHGWRLSMNHTYQFTHRVTSAEVVTTRTMLQRGPYVCAGYFDARSAAELGRLTPALHRLLVALDAAR